MHIAVCIKQVPDEANVRLSQGRWTLEREGVPGQINPDDIVALEVALGLKTELGASVTVLTMGPPQTEEALREALAMGADRAVLISDPALTGSDTLVTSRVLGCALRKLNQGPDLILCGARSSDGNTGQVPPQVAEEISVPYVGWATELEIQGSHALVRRRWERSYQVLKVRLPALISMAKARNLIRHAHLGTIFEAFDGPKVLRWGIMELGLTPDEVGLAGSATLVRGLRETTKSRRGKTFHGSPDKAARLVVEELKKHGVILGGVN